MSEEENAAKSRDFDTRTEITRNFIGGGAGCTLGYFLGYLADSQALSFVLFFVLAYLGYNVRTIVPSFKQHFIPVMQLFWKGLLKINPHPIITLPMWAYFACWFFVSLYSCMFEVVVCILYWLLHTVWP